MTRLTVSSSIAGDARNEDRARSSIRPWAVLLPVLVVVVVVLGIAQVVSLGGVVATDEHRRDTEMIEHFRTKSVAS